MKIVTARSMTFPLIAGKTSATPVEISSVLPGYPYQAAADFDGDIFIAPQRFPLRPTRRLVVLVPDGSLEDGLLARKIWQMSSAPALQVLFLSISSDEAGAFAIRRRLALLSASLLQAGVNTSTSVVVGGTWNLAVKKVLRSGDLLVCLARHKDARHAILPRALGENLAAVFGIPVYMLGGLKVGWSPVLIQRMRSLMAWSVSLFILVGFAGIQIWINQKASPQLSSILICLSLVGEAITLFKANEWIG